MHCLNLPSPSCPFCGPRCTPSLWKGKLLGRSGLGVSCVEEGLSLGLILNERWNGTSPWGSPCNQEGVRGRKESEDMCNIDNVHACTCEQCGQGTTRKRGLTPVNQSSSSSPMWSTTLERSPALILSLSSSLSTGRGVELSWSSPAPPTTPAPRGLLP